MVTNNRKWGSLPLNYVAIGIEVIANHMRSVLNRLNADDVAISLAAGDIPYAEESSVGKVLSTGSRSEGSLLSVVDGVLEWVVADATGDLVTVNQLKTKLSIPRVSSLNDISIVDITPNTATVSVGVNNPNVDELTVYLRYRIVGDSSWSDTVEVVSSYEEFVFELTDLTALKNYDVEVSLASSFRNNLDTRFLTAATIIPFDVTTPPSSVRIDSSQSYSIPYAISMVSVTLYSGQGGQGGQGGGGGGGGGGARVTQGPRRLESGGSGQRGADGEVGGRTSVTNGGQTYRSALGTAGVGGRGGSGGAGGLAG